MYEMVLYSYSLIIQSWLLIFKRGPISQEGDAANAVDWWFLFWLLYTVAVFSPRINNLFLSGPARGNALDVPGAGFLLPKIKLEASDTIVRLPVSGGFAFRVHPLLLKAFRLFQDDLQIHKQPVIQFLLALLQYGGHPEPIPDIILLMKVLHHQLHRLALDVGHFLRDVSPDTQDQQSGEKTPGDGGRRHGGPLRGQICVWRTEDWRVSLRTTKHTKSRTFQVLRAGEDPGRDVCPKY